MSVFVCIELCGLRSPLIILVQRNALQSQLLRCGVSDKCY